MEAVLEILAWVLISGGLFFMLVGTLGVLRMPDVYTRMHAAGMTDTVGAGLLLVGMGCHTVAGMLHGETHWWTVLVRLILIFLFLHFTSPLSSHALARAGLASGLKPWTRDGEGGA